MALIDTKIALPSTGGGVNKNGTPVITGTNGYGDYFTITGVNNTPTTPISVGNTSPVLVGGNTGNIYGDVLTPTLAPELTEPVYSPIIGGGNNLVKPVDPSQYFDGSVVGTVGGGFSSGNKGGVTDEGVITRTPNADDVTFNNGGATLVGRESGTGATYIPTTSNSGTATGTGAGASTNTGAGTGDSTPTTPTDTKTETGETTPMTYEQYIAEQKAREEEKRQAALKEAEIYKERAAADAQASYMQNMSTYGVNAETMAQMGLTGGGYSDYLNAQAYAQKRGDMQTADRNKIAMEQQAQTTYADGIAALNKDLFTYQETQRQNKTTAYNTLLGYAMDAESGLTEETIRAMGKNAGLSEEEIQSVINTMNTAKTNAKGEYSNNAFTALIADLQNPNAYGNYSEAGIRALGKQWGWTDERIQEAVDIWNGTKKENDLSIEEENTINMSEVIKDIQNGAYVKEDNTPYSWEEIKAMLLQARNNGENITGTDIENAKKAYDAWIAYRDGKVSTDEYYNAANGDERAQGIVNNAVDPTKFDAEAKSKAQSYGVREEYAGKVVDTNRDTYKASEFGDFADIDDPNSKQGKYVQAIINDAKAGKIKEGQIVHTNYGNMWSDHGYYMYVGNGVFVRIGDDGFIEMINDGHFKSSKAARDSIYLPDGYHWNIIDHVKQD